MTLFLHRLNQFGWSAIKKGLQTSIGSIPLNSHDIAIQSHTFVGWITMAWVVKPPMNPCFDILYIYIYIQFVGCRNPYLYIYIYIYLFIYLFIHVWLSHCIQCFLPLSLLKSLIDPTYPYDPWYFPHTTMILLTYSKIFDLYIILYIYTHPHDMSIIFWWYHNVRPPQL